jgi:3',5'-cyclic AMP phosphodiesterase CpdA
MTDPTYTPKKMVGWYDPPQLLRTAIDVATSTIIGAQADNRLIEGFVSDANTPQIHDYTIDDAAAADGTAAPRKELWLDCVSDLGEGWNATYAVAKALAESPLTVHDAVTVPGVETRRAMPRARVLMIGGDLVYPVASRDEYQARCVGPYACALPHTDEPSPDYYAVPGNHDWYDGLVAFTRLFCNNRWLGGWRSKQARSYTALRLPGGWWLLGTDLQLDSDIDAPQLAFFRSVAAQMAPTDRVIIYGHYPHWIFAKWYGKFDPAMAENNLNNLAFLDDDVLRNRVRVLIAGHLHYYCRHAHADGRQKITTGGGGAFLHPTHASDMQELAGGFSLKSCYPPAATSRRLAWQNLGFLFRNPYFGVVPALLYALTAYAVDADIGHRGPHEFLGALGDVTRDILSRSPLGAFLVVVLMGGVMLFTDTHSPTYRRVAGFLHALAHVGAAFVLAWAISGFLVRQLGYPFGSIPFSALGLFMMFAGGWVVGSVILGIYLLISLNVFGRHYNEAFSSLRIEDWKSFLRLHITPAGDLEIYSLGIPRVSRTWPPKTDGSEPAPKVELVEPVIVCR